MTKACNKCGADKPLSDYSVDRQRNDGLCRTCKECRTRIRREKYSENPEKFRERARHWIASHPGYGSETKKAWYSRNSEGVRTKNAQRYELNREAKLLQMRKWYADNKEHKNKKSLAWAKLNPEKVAEGFKKWATVNKEKRRETYLAWYEKNPHTRAASSAKRRSAKLLRTPKWLTASEIEAITRLYQYAAQLSKDSGISYVVDHELPLQGRYVSGLHVLANLQVITADENSLKHNKWVPS